MPDKFTPGPWQRGPSAELYDWHRKSTWMAESIEAPEQLTLNLAHVTMDRDSPEESEANARLVAVAPSLLCLAREVAGALAVGPLRRQGTVVGTFLQVA